jgi:hypothetical protein
MKSGSASHSGNARPNSSIDLRDVDASAVMRRVGLEFGDVFDELGLICDRWRPIRKQRNLVVRLVTKLESSSHLH